MRGHVSADQLARLMERPRRSGAGYTAKCPIHDDRMPSLKISPGKKGTLLYCHAGCRPVEILSMFGIDIRQLFYDYREYEAPVKRDLSKQMREWLKRRAPVNLWEPWTLADVMQGALHPTDADIGAERMAYVGVAWTDYLQLPFDPDYEEVYVDDEGYEFSVVGAFKMWHVTADGPVFDYLRPWLERTNGNWHDIKPKAMQALYTYWKNEKGEGVRLRD